LRYLRPLSVTLMAMAASLGFLFGAGAQAEELVKYQGNCLACHVLPIPEQQFHGDVGPDLSESAGNLSEGEIRLRIVNPKVVNPDTIMPAFYRNDGFERVLKNFQGKTMLSAQQVEDVVAYMMTLKSN